MIIPGVQNPHWTASAAANACCKGCGRSGLPSPSMVRTSLPAAPLASVRHARTAFPSTITTQVPHVPSSQPSLVPTRPRPSRSRSSSLHSGGTSRLRGMAFTTKATLVRSVISRFLLSCLAGLPRGPVRSVGRLVREFHYARSAWPPWGQVGGWYTASPPTCDERLERRGSGCHRHHEPVVAELRHTNAGGRLFYR